MMARDNQVEQEPKGPFFAYFRGRGTSSLIWVQVYISEIKTKTFAATSLDKKKASATSKVQDVDAQVESEIVMLGDQGWHFL